MLNSCRRAVPHRLQASGRRNSPIDHREMVQVDALGHGCVAPDLGDGGH